MKIGANKIIFSMIFLVGVLLISSSFISATSTVRGLVPETVITGTVYNDDSGQLSVGAKVTVKCGLASEKTTTDENGVYYFDLQKRKCGKNDKATVIATMDGKSGFNTKTVISKTPTIINVLLGEAGEKTIITGIIYGSDLEHTISGAGIIVSCNNHGKETTSNSDGIYLVLFNQEDCGDGDEATVMAQKGDLTGSNTGIVHEGILGFLDVAIVNVPLVPEFGVIAGLTTVLGAVGTFFFIRKKQHVRVKRK